MCVLISVLQAVRGCKDFNKAAKVSSLQSRLCTVGCPADIFPMNEMVLVLLVILFHFSCLSVHTLRTSSPAGLSFQLHLSSDIIGEAGALRM